MNKVLLTDYASDYTPLKLVESLPTPDGPHTGAVIATLFGVLSDYGNETRNDRWYSLELWEKVLSDPLYLEVIKTKTLFGEPDHPMDVENRLEVHIPYVSHIIRDVRINREKQVVEGYIDILDVPYGRIIKTLIDYGCILGVSSRGSGDLVNKDGKTIVDPETYQFITWDIVARPSNKTARVHELDTINVNGAGLTAYESIDNQIGKFIENKDINSLRLTESLLISSGIPDKDSLLVKINENIEKSSEEDIDDDNTLDSEISEAYSRIMELKSQVDQLSSDNIELQSKLDKSLNTIKDLKSVNENLTSMVSNYACKIVETLESTTEGSSTKHDAVPKTTCRYVTESVDYAKIHNLITNSNEAYYNKLAEAVEKTIAESLKSSKSTINLTRDNTLLKSEVKILKSQLSEVDMDNSDLKNKYSECMKEYIKVRCSQLGVDEKLVIKKFNKSIEEHNISDIERTISEMYKSSSSSSYLKESKSTTHDPHQYVLGKVNVESQRKLTESKDDDEHNSLVNTIRSVKLN